MIGLEYILEVFDIQQKDLAEELGIKKQNINLWIKGKQNISKKYLPILSKKFDIPAEYFQKDLLELDKKFIEKKQLGNYMDKDITSNGDTKVKKEFERILKKNGIYYKNIEDVMYAVTDMLYCLQDKIKEKEPYAIHSIKRLEVAAQEVNDLVWII